MKLYKWQDKVLRSLIMNKSIGINAPAGAGKTLPHIMYINYLLSNNKINNINKVFWLVPYKALANSIYEDLKNNFDESIIGIMTGDLKLNIDNSKVIVAIYESFFNYKNKSDSVFVIMDEIHTIYERNGIMSTYKFVINNIKQYSLISATFNNLKDYLKKNDLYIKVENSIKFKIKPSIISLNGISFHYDNLYRNFISKYSTLIFRFSKSRIIEDVKYFINKINIDKKLESIIEKDNINDLLYESLIRGFGYHNSDLTIHERNYVESLYRNKIIKFLIVSDSVATGVNLPAELLIMKDVKKYYDKIDSEEYIDQNLLIQIYGRVGRKGFSNKAIIIIPKDNIPKYFYKPEQINVG